MGKIIGLTGLFFGLSACGGGPLGGGPGGGGAGPFNTDAAVPLTTPQLARDGSGGLHVLSASPSKDAQGKTTVRYGTCKSGCDAASGFSFVTMDDTSGALFDQVKLAVEPSGRVHLVELLDATKEVRYFTCPSDCGKAASWAAVKVGLPANFTSPSLPAGRAFAVSDAGKPRLLVNAYAGAGPQVMVLGCDGTCTDGNGWRADPIVDGKALVASMTPGEPHQAVLGMDQGFSIVYAECASQCADATKWTQAQLMTANAGPGQLSLVRGSGGELNLALKSSLAVSADQTLYGRCTGQCGLAGSWTMVEALRGEDGRGGLDLALGSGGAVAIALATVANDLQELKWVHCAGSCASGGAWSSNGLEKGLDVKESAPTDPGAACSNPKRWWAVGNAVQIVPGAGGGYALAYDATGYDQCLGSSTTSYITASFVRLRAQPSP
jgi:hypothetical protein